MINVQVLGRISTDIEVKTIKTRDNNQFSVTTFDIATNRKHNRDEVDFITCKAYYKLGELIDQYSKKGHRILIKGVLQIDKYQNKENQTRIKPIIQVEEIEFIEKRS